MPIGAEILGENFIQLETVHQKIGHISLQNEMLIWQYICRWCQINDMEMITIPKILAYDRLYVWRS